ncbi:MAG TPA: family 16 glycoside hydrolase [Pirellulales bacterium]|nr:family 16 glycoside hydrolase [Pirellulales bacterium]
MQQPSTTTIQPTCRSFGARPCAAALIAGLLVAAPVARAADDEAGFKPIFNGTNLDGWDGNPKFWSVRDGTITGRTSDQNETKGNTFIIWRDGELDDFELRLQYKIVGGNSGIQYRSADRGNWVVGGYQGDFEAGDSYSGILYDELGRGILAQRGEKTTIGADHKPQKTGQVGDTAELQKAIKKEDWNDYTIIARGNHLQHFINGKQTCDVTDDDPTDREMAGILALQLHAGPPMTVQFRNIRLKRPRLEGRKKIVMVAGRASHGPGDHEFNAGVKLLRGCLNKIPTVQAAEYHNGWPRDPTAFDNADTVLLYMDGGGGHPLIEPDHLRRIAELMHQGVGLACCHYAVEVPKDRGGPELLAWIGGYYETGYSINPHWDADFKTLPKHPITQGVKPFTINDEWYYNMRFREGAITPILVATPPDATRGTEEAKKFPGRPEIVAWTTERPDGGRGFGFTGGHFHRNWANDDFRKLVLNALFWTAKAEVPADGVPSTVAPDELAKNLDKK